MRLSWIFIIFFIYTDFSLASEQDYDPYRDQEWVEVGDMYVPAESLVEEGVNERGLIQKNIRLWRDGIVRYQFSTSVSQANRRMFIEACEEMGEFANVSCQPKRAQDRDYIQIQSNSRNICGSSFLGRRGGRQNFVINCWRFRTIQHELMHALGFSHEHNRMDRDEHITIVWANLTPGLEHNYRKVSLANTQRVLSYYDFDSIMQYDSFGGSVNGGIVMYRTELGPSRGRIRQTDEMSFGDHFILYTLYGGIRPS
jgi:hypothetical protein